MEYYFKEGYKKKLKDNNCDNSIMGMLTKGKQIMIFVATITAIVSCIALECLTLAGKLMGVVVFLYIVLVSSVAVLTIIAVKESRNNIEAHGRKHMDKLELLNEFLINEYNICSKEKTEQLIDKCQERVEEHKKATKESAKVMGEVFGGIAGILGMWADKTSVTFLLVITIALIVGCLIVSIIKIAGQALDNTVKEYETVIKDLKDLIFIKYQ